MYPTAGTSLRIRSIGNKLPSTAGLQQQNSPLDQPVNSTAKPATADAGTSPDTTTESLQAGLHKRGYAAGSIDGKLGPKTLEALNLFQQHQIDSLKAQIHNTPNPALRAQLDIRLSALIRESKGIKPGRETLSALADPLAKRVAKSASGGLDSVAIRRMPLSHKTGG